MRIALTGATGLLGRNLLFEILKQNLGKLDDLEILVLGRPQNELPLNERLGTMIAEDGFDYIDVPQAERPELKKKIDQCIIPISFDLVHDKLGISQEEYIRLKNARIDHFFHVAAQTDFRTDKEVEVRLEEVNVRGTQKVLKLIGELNVGQVVYIGSAYSCGSKVGRVEPDYVNLDEHFRNPYEKSKLRAEVEVRRFAREKGVKCKVFRPTTICGRLIEKPTGSINKFDVFYAWGAFFLRLKLKQFKSVDHIYDKPLEVPVRIHFNSNSGLNIVPCDYAAKVLYQASVNGWEGESFHLANNAETPHELYTGSILQGINIKGYSFVPEEPADKNVAEKFYYKTVGKLFTPYASNDPIFFNVSNLGRGLKKIGLACPVVDGQNLVKLIDFAKKKYFNLSVEGV